MAPNTGAFGTQSPSTVTSTRPRTVDSARMPEAARAARRYSGHVSVTDSQSSSDSDSTCEEEPAGGVTLPAMYGSGVDFGHGAADGPLASRYRGHEADDSESSPSISSDSDDTEGPSSAENDLGVNTIVESSLSLAGAANVTGNTENTLDLQSTLLHDSALRQNARRGAGELREDGDGMSDAEPASGRSHAPPDRLLPEGFPLFLYSFDPEYVHPDGGPGKNLNVVDFLRIWRDRRILQKRNHPPDSIDYLPPINSNIDVSKLIQALTGLIITADALGLEDGNFQGLSWDALGTTKNAVQEARRKTYIHHCNRMSCTIAPQYCDINGLSRFRRHTRSEGVQSLGDIPDIPSHDNHLRFCQMNLRCKPCLTHFQLRHMLSASSKNAVFYAGNSKVFALNPETGGEDCVMHFERSPSHSEFDDISTISATHDLLVIGSLGEQYAIKSLSTSNDNKFVKGWIAPGVSYGGTNHVHTFLSRQSGSPQAVFCLNDGQVRVLDCHSNEVIADQKIGWAVNCSTTSPDGRLRLLIGDQTDPWIVAAETGKAEVHLPGHKDHGFACDWAPDGLHVATGNQDGIVQIFDCRNWAQPIKVLPTELGGVRTMKFSPLGSGKRVLAMAEPADFVSIVDAETFASKQRFEFLGEIGGLSFTPDGSRLYVANTDPDFGGILEFDRAGDGQQYGFASPEQHNKHGGRTVYECTHLDDELLHSTRKRKRRGWGLDEVRI